MLHPIARFSIGLLTVTRLIGINLIGTVLILTGCAAGPVAGPTAQSPSGFTATPTGGTIELRWNGTGAASSYSIERRSSTGSFVSIASTKKTSFMDTDIQGNRAYAYRLIANDAPSKALESNLVFTPPEPMPGEVLFQPAVLNPVKVGETARLEALTNGTQSVTWSVLPNTGTLVVNGRQASFASGQPGVYSITATDTLAPNRSAQTSLRVLKPTELDLLTLVGPAFTYVDANATLRLGVGGNDFNDEVTWSVTPSGPVIARNGNAYTFVANKPGVYAIQASTTAISSETLKLEVRRSEVLSLVN